MNSLNGFRGSLAQSAMQQHADSTPNVLGKLPSASTYIDPRMMTQPTQAFNIRPVNNLPVEQLGLGIPDAKGRIAPAQQWQPQHGTFQPWTGMTSEMQEAQQKQMEMQQQSQYASLGSSLGGLAGGVGTAWATGAAIGSIVPVIGTAVGAILGGVAGWLLGD